ncbi:galactokinase [Candidatus Pacearchaeota archaeon]|nr:galactokinase [Candidatus Pacearchaeota archaeon]
MIITRAPLRVSLGGGGSDLPFYSSKFGGFLISAAINKYNYIIVEKRDFTDEMLIRYSKTETVKFVKDIKHTRIKSALEYLNINEPIEITTIADVPAGTGLGSSSTFMVALLKALHTYKREDISSEKLAEEAALIEIKILNEPIGKHDQYLASYGGVVCLDIDKTGNVFPSKISMSHSTLEELENNILLFSTGIIRNANEVLLDQKKNSESDESKMEQMHIIKDIGKEIKTSLEQGDCKKFGKWLNVHWETKKKFSEKMSSGLIDSSYEAGLKSGAIGGKLVGAGGGGFLMFYCDNNKRQLRETMEKIGLKELNFRFDGDGCKVIYEGK